MEHAPVSQGRSLPRARQKEILTNGVITDLTARAEITAFGKAESTPSFLVNNLPGPLCVTRSDARRFNGI